MTRRIVKQAQQIGADTSNELLESFNAIPWILDIQSGCFTYVGPQAEEVLGYPVEDWYQHLFWVNHLHPDDRDWAAEFCAASTKRLQDHDFEYRMIAADGSSVWLRDQVIVKVENGIPVSLQGLMFDVTKRKLAEQALTHLIGVNAADNIQRFFQVCVEQLASAYQTSYAFIGLLPAGETERVQTQAVWAHGKSAENFEYALAGTPCKDILDQNRAMVADNVAEEYPDDHMLVEMKARSYFGAPLVDSRGRTLGLVSVIDTKAMILEPWMEPLLGHFAQRIGYELERSHIEKDLVEAKAQVDDLLKERTRELRSSEDRLSLLLASSPLVVYTARVDGDFVTSFVSDNVATQMGYSADNFSRQPGFWFDHIHTDDQPVVKEHLSRLRQKGSGTIEYRFLMPDGDYQWFLDYARVTDHRETGGAEIVGYRLNINEHKQAETELARAKQEAEDSSLAKTEFLSRISHELRTPLNAILGFSQLMQMDNATLPDNQRQYIGEIIDAGEHLLHLVNEVLDLSRIEQGKLRLEISAVNVREILQECMNMVQPLLHEHNITMTVDCQIDHQCAVLADPVCLKQIMLNLLSNAAKYNRPGGQVSLKCVRERPDKINISVSDTGIGIAVEDMADLFSVFSRLGAEYSEIEGAGVGLAICKRLVEEMGGSIDVESEQGVGSTFWLELPLANSTVDNINMTDKPVQSRWNSDEGALAGGSKTVLYVEDNLQNQRIVEEMMGRCYDVEFLVAGSGQRALQLIEQTVPDVILLDIHLSDMNGYEFYQQMCSVPGRNNIPPVIAISAYAMPEDIQKSKETGFVDYVTKPIDFNYFFNVLDQFIPRRSQ